MSRREDWPKEHEDALYVGDPVYPCEWERQATPSAPCLVSGQVVGVLEQEGDGLWWVQWTCEAGHEHEMLCRPTWLLEH
jgi:hypothetical protein